MIVTIDGPAGAGKSTAARMLADRFGYRFLDTGALYRAVALAGKRARVDWSNPAELADLTRGLDIRLDGQRILLDGEDVTNAIRTMEITSVTKYAADNVVVRKLLTNLQRQIADGQDVVTEGRDQATIVFPQAECKIYLAAGEEERARRRFEDLRRRGENIDYDEVLRRQRIRDEQDGSREHGGLAKAPDSIDVCTDGLSPAQVVDRLEQLVQQAQSAAKT